MITHEPYDTSLIDAALRRLGVGRFALAIHDASFPSTPAEDIGRGSPYSRGGLGFFEFARGLGFNAIQLGPQGKTPRGDLSPYNSCIFAKTILSLSALTLADDDRLPGIVPREDLDRLWALRDTQQRPAASDRVDYATAWQFAHELLAAAYARFRVCRDARPTVAAAFGRYVAEQNAAGVNWFQRDCVYEALALASGVDDWRLWGQPDGSGIPLDQRLYCPESGEEPACRQRIADVLQDEAAAVEQFAFGQFLLHLQHEQMRAAAHRLGLLVYGDMHIGCSHQDWWAWRSLFMSNYRLGAPPSRTTQEGQPWNYPVFDPRQMASVGPRGELRAGPALDFVRARAAKLLAEFDGMRIDHPQGLVCPWVYRADDPDPFRAVREGARLYSSPDRPDHPELRQFAIVPPAQLNPDPAYPRHGDRHVWELLLAQVDRYAVGLDAVLAAAHAAGRRTDDILCEVLSTWPAPLKAVMQQRGMGRFCITQKADPRDPHDVYRPENTSAGDWIMVGNHDTKPLWLLVAQRQESVWMRERAGLLAERLVPEPARRPAFAAQLAGDRRRFCEAMFAELFLGPAQNVSVFFADLLGEQQLYNEPGTTGGQNWSLRVPGDYRDLYLQRLQRGEALDIARALALALEARAATLGPEAAALAERLRRQSPGRAAFNS